MFPFPVTVAFSDDSIFSRRDPKSYSLPFFSNYWVIFITGSAPPRNVEASPVEIREWSRNWIKFFIILLLIRVYFLLGANPKQDLPCLSFGLGVGAVIFAKTNLQKSHKPPLPKQNEKKNIISPILWAPWTQKKQARRDLPGTRCRLTPWPHAGYARRWPGSHIEGMIRCCLICFNVYI